MAQPVRPVSISAPVTISTGAPVVVSSPVPYGVAPGAPGAPQVTYRAPAPVTYPGGYVGGPVPQGRVIQAPLTGVPGAPVVQSRIVRTSQARSRNMGEGKKHLTMLVWDGGWF